MSRFTSISNDLWLDRDFRRLTAVGKIVYIYVLTSPHNNQSGLYRLPSDYVTYDIGVEAKEELIKGCKLWKYDSENEVVFIPNYLKYNTARSVQQINGVIRSISTLPCTYLFSDFLCKLVSYCGEEVLAKVPNHIKESALRVACERADIESRNLAILLNNYIS